jgi:predicted esterase
MGLAGSPTISITANFGMQMPGWFDIKAFDFKSAEDEEGMMKTVHSLNQLITSEVDAGVDPSRIVLGGFSQGGAMTLLTGLTNERRLAGLVVLSGWLPLRYKVKAASIRRRLAQSKPIELWNTDGLRENQGCTYLLGSRN